MTVQARPRIQLDFIDALRGVAIVGVLLSHAQRNVEIYQAMGRPALMSPWITACTAPIWPCQANSDRLIQ